MILADTSIWIDYLRGRSQNLQPFLDSGRVVMHPFIIAEVALGSLRDRRGTFLRMQALWSVEVADHSDLRSMIELRHLYSRGIGHTDAHLVASCLLTPGTRLWTRDARLHAVATSLAISFDPAV